MTRRIHSCWLDSFPHTRVCEIFIHSINKQKKNFLFSIFSGLYCGCVIAAHHDQIVKHVVSSFTFVRLWFASAIAWMNSPLAWLFPAALFFHATKDMGREVQCLPGQHVWIHQFTSSMPVFYIHILFFIYFLFIFLSVFLFLFYLIMIYFWTESNLLPILKWHPCWNGRARFVFPSKAWVLARPFLALWFLEHFSTNPMHTTLPPMHIYIYTQKTSQAAHWISRWRMLMMSYFCVVADDQIRYPIEPVSASAAGRDQGRSMVGRHRTESRTWT